MYPIYVPDVLLLLLNKLQNLQLYNEKGDDEDVI